MKTDLQTQGECQKRTMRPWMKAGIAGSAVYLVLALFFIPWFSDSPTIWGAGGPPDWFGFIETFVAFTLFPLMMLVGGTGLEILFYPVLVPGTGFAVGSLAGWITTETRQAIRNRHNRVAGD